MSSLSLSAPEALTVEANDLRLAVLGWPAVEGTEDAGDTVFLLHGFLDLAYGMVPLAQALRRAGVGAALYAPDWRGHGDSEWLGRGGYYHFPDYVSDLDVLVRELGVGRLMLVGHSMGGGAGSLFAGAYPERVFAFVNAEGFGPPAGTMEETPERLARWADSVREARSRREGGRGLASLEEVAARLRAANPRLSQPLATALAPRATRQGADGRYRWKFDPLHRTPSAYPFQLAQAAAIWRSITAPTLLIEGAQSPLRELPDVQERRALFRNRRLRVLEDTGHMFHQDAPDATAALVAEHWRDAREGRFTAEP